MKHVLVVGEPLVESIEDPAGTIHRGFGGDALNVAVYLARGSPDLHVMLATSIGDDGDSDALLMRCREELVDDRHIRRVAGGVLGRYRVMVDRFGERAFAYERSESPFRGALERDDELPDPSLVDALCFSGITVAVLHDPGRRALFAYATSVGEAGGQVVFDPNHRPALWLNEEEARTWTARIAEIADVVVASTEDGRRLTDGDTATEIALAFRVAGAREVVVTDGSAPCIVASGGEVQAVAAGRPGKVIDTTAAGDAFTAAYVAARLRGESPLRSAEAGHALAAIVVGHRGALSSE